MDRSFWNGILGVGIVRYGGKVLFDFMGSGYLMLALNSRMKGIGDLGKVRGG